MKKDSYCNGSDMLVYVNGEAVGHCSTHTVTCSSATKEHAVKPVASAPMANSLWTDKTVSGLSLSIKADGLVFYGETEGGYKKLLALWKAGKPVKVKCMERGDSPKPYLECACVISSLERTDPAQDDSSYSVSLENAGAPDTLDETALTEGAPEEGA